MVKNNLHIMFTNFVNIYECLLTTYIRTIFFKGRQNTHDKDVYIYICDLTPYCVHLIIKIFLFHQFLVLILVALPLRVSLDHDYCKIMYDRICFACVITLFFFACLKYTLTITSQNVHILCFTAKKNV